MGSAIMVLPQLMIALLRLALGSAFESLPINSEYSPDEAELRMTPRRFKSGIERSATDLIEPTSRGPSDKSFSCGSKQRSLQPFLSGQNSRFSSTLVVANFVSARYPKVLPALA